MRLVRKAQPTHAAMLLFAAQPLAYHIRVGRLKNAATIIDDRQITGNLFAAVDEAMQAIKSHLSLSYSFDGSIKRIETWEYPLQAVREALLNAVVHRDYTVPSDIQIKIFDNCITIYSPGKLYGDLTVQQLIQNRYQSHLRNKLIAEAFYLTCRIEKYGSGIARIQQEIEAYPSLQFSIEEIANGILVSFVKELELTGEVTGEVMRLLNVCDGEKSRKELQGLLGLQHEDHFRKAYLLPAIAAGLLEMTRPATPKSRMQRYRLTEKGWRYTASKR
jgi:ATP-dependent DNA helicase RecG